MKKRDPELEALVQLSDDDIDTSDISEVTDWRGAVVGKFYRPIKEPVTLRLDADIIAWLKSGGPGYQTRINALLRTAMIRTGTNAGAVEGDNAECEAGDGGRKLDGASRAFRFPTLEQNRQLNHSYHVADLIQKRGSVFASAA